MRPTPFQAYLRIQIGCDKFCTYCIVPMTRGPEQGRPPRADPRRGPRSWPIRAAWKSRCWARRSTATATRTAADDAAGRPAGRSCTRSTGIQRLKFVTNYPKDMTRRSAAGGPRSAESLALPARARSKRFEPSARNAMKRGYTVEDYREMMDRIRETRARRGRLQRLHRRLLRRNRRGLPADGRTGPRVPLQEQLHLQIQRAAGHQGPPTGCRTMCRRRSRKRRNNEAAGAAKPDQRTRITAVDRTNVRSPGGRAEQEGGARRGAASCS